MFLYILLWVLLVVAFAFFFFNDTATTEIYTLSLHDALPICRSSGCLRRRGPRWRRIRRPQDRKSTRLNSSHTVISYAVFCLKKKIHLLLAPCINCLETVKKQTPVAFKVM